MHNLPYTLINRSYPELAETTLYAGKKWLTCTKAMILLLVAMLLGFNVSFAQKKEGLNNIIHTLLTEQKLAGAVWATVSEKGEIVTDAAGYKNTKSKVLLRPPDKVHVGSISKTILATGFLRLASLKLINLDDPVKKYLPDLPMTNRWQKTNPVTIRHLLDHTAGLTDAKLWHVFSTTSTANTPLHSFYLRNPDLLTIKARPGSIYSYSNMGYTLLGMVIEQITQTRYEQYLDDQLLKPLGMLNSTFKFVTQSGNQADSNLAAGHLDDGQPVFAMPTYLRPAGQFTTTAADMGIFLRFMMSGGELNGSQFINTEYLRSVGQQRQTDAFKQGVPFGDAMGAYARDRYGVVGLAKNGNIVGFSSMIYMFPDQQKAFFIAHNMDSETADYDVFNRALAQQLELPTTPFRTEPVPTDNQLQHWGGYYIPIITKVEPFGLLDMLFSHSKVTIEKNGALLEPMQGKTKRLQYEGNYLFSMADRINISHSFYQNGEGEFCITEGTRTIRKTNGLVLLTIAASMLLGMLAIAYAFVTGIVGFIRFRTTYWRHPGFWTFLPILTTIVAIILIANQPFLRLGDKTIGSITLAVGTSLMPLLSLLSLILMIRQKPGFLYRVSFWATLFILQFSLLLMANNLIPLILWR